MSALRLVIEPTALRRLDEDAREQAASQFLESALEHRRSGAHRILRHPFHAAAGLALLRSLPEVVHASTRGSEAAAVRRGLLRGAPLRRAAISGATAVLALPTQADDYLLGASKQTLRRKIRAAEKLGVTWRPVASPTERETLLRLLDESERNNARSIYRHPHPQNSDLLDIAQWLVALAGDGRPILLAVTPVDGEWAVLRTFRTLDDSAEASAARYLMSWIVAEHLIGRGVRYLADSQSPASLPSGLRFFQRIIGYRLVRVRVRVLTAGASTSKSERS